MLISPWVREKLKQADHNVTEDEIEQCFANRDRGECIDTRAWHATDPKTRWFVAETDRGRRLKVIYVLRLDGIVEIKSAYPATDEVLRIYEKYAKQWLYPGNAEITMNIKPEGSIDDTPEAWAADGPLGNDAGFTQAATEDISSAVDSALGLQPISIRLQKSLLDNLKALAQINGLGYQPLIRQVLTRFVDCELKAMLHDRAVRETAERAMRKQAEEVAPEVEAPRRAA